MAATLTGALTATAEPRKVEVMAAILMCVVTCIRGYGSDAMRGSDARQEGTRNGLPTDPHAVL